MKRLSLLMVAIGLLTLSWTSLSGAEEHRLNDLVLGVDIGPTFGSLDGTAFNLGVSGDYYIAPNLSFGPLMQLTLTGNLTQIALSGQLKYSFGTSPSSNFLPNLQAGLGFVNADHGGHDTSYIIPVGLGLEYRLLPSLYLSTTALVNFSNLDNGEGFWQNSLNLLFGIRVAL